MEETRKPDSDAVLATLGGETADTVTPKKWYKAGAAILLLILAAIPGWYLLTPSAPAIKYRTESVARHDLSVRITATGQLAPVNEVDVGSELSGTIAKVAVDYNDTVTAGQILATLDTSELDAAVVEQKAALQVAEARVDQAQATVVEAQLKYDRNRNLVVQKLASQQDLDVSLASLTRAKADLNGARAQVAQAKASLDAITSKLAKSVIRAPISGIVLSRSVEPGQTVAAAFNTPVLFSLAEDLRHMELHVDVDEADVGHLEAGQPASFTVDAWPGRIFTADVTQVRYAPRTVEGVVTYETLLSVDNADLSLRPGMTATAEITVAKLTDALLAPNAALRFNPPADAAAEDRSANLFTRLMPRHQGSRQQTGRVQGQSTVWVLDKGGPRAVTIQTGMTDGRYTAITSGELKVGDPLIIGTVSGAQ